MQLTAIFQGIETSQLVRLVATLPGLYPALSAMHILGIGLLVGSIVTVDLRLLRVLGTALDSALPWLVRLALSGFAIAALTGVFLASVRIGTYAQNAAFLTKMGILTAAGANALILRLAMGSADITPALGRRHGMVAAGLSLALWPAAVFAGRWIAFV